jgi:hypothetical protein
MTNRQKAVAFDVDSQSLATLREAFPNWELEVSNGATVGSLRQDWGPAREALVRALLEAGAHGCLILPVHAKDLVTSVTRARTGSEPGQHTLALDRAQREDPWQDNGGEA